MARAGLSPAAQKVFAQVQQTLIDLTPKAVRTLALLLDDDDAAVALKAAKDICDRSPILGKPVQRQEIINQEAEEAAEAAIEDFDSLVSKVAESDYFKEVANG